MSRLLSHGEATTRLAASSGFPVRSLRTPLCSSRRSAVCRSRLCPTRAQNREQDVALSSDKSTDTSSFKDSLVESVAGNFDGATLAAILAVGSFAFFQHVDMAVAAGQDSAASDHLSTALPVFSLAEGEDFWANVARYGRFFITVMTGTVYVMVKPLGELLKRPVTAVLVIAGLGLTYFVISSTLQAMLGLSDFEYVPSSPVVRGFGA